jgi:hypothetical protein
MSAGVKRLSTLAVALVIFGLAGSAIAVTAPRLFTGPERPGFIVFLTLGVAVILLTAGLFGYIYRLGLGFGKTVLVLAAGYNALIAAVKFALAPAALYQANQEQTFDASVGDPNSMWFYLAVSSAVLLLYLLVFRVMYAVFKRRFRRQGVEITAPRERRSRWGDRRRVVLVALVITIVAILGSFLWVIPVFFVGLPTVSYLVYVFSTFGTVITLALILAAILAYKTFDEVEKRAVHLGDATLLATFFWLGCALILLYHAMWVVFLLTLISIWPFQTYTPK